MAKRGRKSIAKERRAQILDAFHRCAVRSGLEKASLREVAEEAGLPVSNLHHYFKNRDEIVSELVKQITGGIIDTLRAEVQGFGDPQTRLNKIFEFLFSPKAQKLEDGSLYYDFWSLAHRSKTVRRTFQNQVRDQRETIFEVLLETSDIPKLSQADKKEMANLIIALVEGTFFILDMDGKNVSPKKMAHMMTRFLKLYAEEQMREKTARITN
jgi:AcrR family transcriptional regulator